jgi:hypothetical protein
MVERCQVVEAKLPIRFGAGHEQPHHDLFMRIPEHATQAASVRGDAGGDRIPRVEQQQSVSQQGGEQCGWARGGGMQENGPHESSDLGVARESERIQPGEQGNGPALKHLESVPTSGDGCSDVSLDHEPPECGRDRLKLEGRPK